MLKGTNEVCSRENGKTLEHNQFMSEMCVSQIVTSKVDPRHLKDRELAYWQKEDEVHLWPEIESVTLTTALEPSWLALKSLSDSSSFILLSLRDWDKNMFIKIGNIN